jgi:hypothetical protein
VMGENYIMRSFMIFAHHIFGRWNGWGWHGHCVCVVYMGGERNA